MSNTKGISMITLIITIIVMIILAAIAFMVAGDQVGSAQFSKFASEFGEYATNFANAPLAEVTEALGLSGKSTNKAQKIYAAARDIDLKEFDVILNGVIIPGGYTTTRFQTDIKDSTGATYELASATTPVYEIKDNIMKEYEGKKFYGDANGKETHWVTATGIVFTIPGFPRTVDGEERMYITPDLYYVSMGADMITVDDLFELAPVIVAGDVVPGNQTAADAADSETVGGKIEDEEEEEVPTNNLAEIRVGDYIAYTPNTSASVQWRVWEVNDNNVVIMPTSPVGSLKLGYNSSYDSKEVKLEECLRDYSEVEKQIEELCDEYASSSLGITGANIRSLTIEDLEAVEISDVASKKADYSLGIGYGNTQTYQTGNYFVVSYDGSKNNISSIFNVASEANPITVMQTYYKVTAPGWKSLPVSSETYGTLLGSTKGWLASPCVYCIEPIAYFYVHTANNGNVDGSTVFDSSGNTSSSTCGVRPLISLSTSALTVNEENPGNGSITTPWNLMVK